MKNGWKTRHLGEVATFSQGIQVGLEKQVTAPKEGYVRFIRIIDYTQNTDDIRYIPNPGGKYFVNEEDLVMVRYGTPGLIGRGKSGVIANNLFKIKVEIKDLNNDYLALYLSQDSIQQYLSTQGSATMPALNFGQLRTVMIKFPPLHEQKRIVTLLNQSFTAINKAKENTEKNLKNVREFFESYLKEIFSNAGQTWVEKTFQQVCLLQRGFDLPTHERKAGGFPLVSSNGITDSIDAYKVDPPGVVTGRSGTIGNVHYIEDKFWPLNTALYVKQFHNNNPRFIYYFLKQFNLKKYTSGAGVPTLNRNNVHSVKVYIPSSIDEQSSIANKLDSIWQHSQSLESVYQRKLLALEELKKSILHKAFSGGLSETFEQPSIQLETHA